MPAMTVRVEEHICLGSLGGRGCGCLGDKFLMTTLREETIRLATKTATKYDNTLQKICVSYSSHSSTMTHTRRPPGTRSLACLLSVQVLIALLHWHPTAQNLVRSLWMLICASTHTWP